MRLVKSGGKYAQEATEMMDREFLGGRRQGFYPWTLSDRRSWSNAGFVANIWKLAKECPETAGPLVAGMYTSGPPQVRKAALRILARQRKSDFLPRLRKCLGSG
mgnify:CR=1 FL=1